MFHVDWFQQKAALVKFSPQTTLVDILFIYLFIYLFDFGLMQTLPHPEQHFVVYRMNMSHDGLWCIL